MTLDSQTDRRTGLLVLLGQLVYTVYMSDDSL